MAKLKYLKDYVPYMKELYPFLTEEAILEMMQDSFEIIRKSLVKPREIKIHRRESKLFEDKDLEGNFIISTIFDNKYKGKIISQIDRQRKKANEEINRK